MPPRVSRQRLRSSRQHSLISVSQCRQLPTFSRPFSTTPHTAAGEHPEKRTYLRRKFVDWLNGPGKYLKDPQPHSTNYLGAYDFQGRPRKLTPEDGEGEEEESRSVEIKNEEVEERDLRPFPNNPNFRSQAVLANDMKDAIYDDVMSGKLTVREASEKYNVDMRRVGAVVRLKEVEKQWKAQGKPLVTAYEKAILGMLPTTTLKSRRRHESINDLPVHSATSPQLFYPTSESRRFTRADAGIVFDSSLKPADERIPHPEMILMNKGSQEGDPKAVGEKQQNVKEMYREIDRKKQEWDTREERQKMENTTIVNAGRWEWRFENVVIDHTKTGRYDKGIGRRYGVPAQDRKKGQVKIPRKVEW